INIERQYLARVEDFDFLPNSLAGMKKIRALGLGMIIVTNQSGLASGYFDRTALDAIHQRLSDMAADAQAAMDGIYICPHSAGDGSACRKPAPGLALQAARDHGFDLTDAFVIGDKPCDIELARRIGATAILVRTGYGEQCLADANTKPDYIVADL